MSYSKEVLKEYFRKHNTNNICECGGKYKKYFKKAHEKTKKHQKYIKNT